MGTLIGEPPLRSLKKLRASALIVEKQLQNRGGKQECSSKKKLLSALLAAYMVFGLTAPAYAAEQLFDEADSVQHPPMEDTVIHPVLPAGTFAELYGTMPEAPTGRPKARAATNNVYRADYYGAQLAQIYGNNYSTDGYNALVSSQNVPNLSNTTVRYTNPIKATSKDVVDKYAVETLGGYKPYTSDHPGFFWDNGSIDYEDFEYVLNSPINTLTMLTGKWIGAANQDYSTIEEVNDDITDLNAAVDQILAGIGPDWSDYQKLVYFNETLVGKIVYDGDTADTSSRRAFNATGALLDNKAVSDGYVKAFKMLCDRVDIPCLRVSGTGVTFAGGGNHSWNYVQLKGSWYAVDLTWNDPSIRNVNGELVDNSAYWWDYFLVGYNTKDYMNSNFIETHLPNVTEDDSGNEILAPYQVPTLSKFNYKPTTDEATSYPVTTTKTGNGVFSPENPNVVEHQNQKIEMQASAGSFVYSYQTDAEPLVQPWTYSKGMSSSQTFWNVDESHTLSADFRPVEGNKKINVTTKVVSGIGTIDAGTFVPKGVDRGYFCIIPGSGYEVESCKVTCVVNGVDTTPQIYEPVFSPYYGYDAAGDTTIEVSFKAIPGLPLLDNYESSVYTASDDTTVVLKIPTENGSLDTQMDLSPLSDTPASEKARQKVGDKEILAAYEISLSDTATGDPVHKIKKPIDVFLDGLDLEAGTSYAFIGVHQDGTVTVHPATVLKLSMGKITFASSQFSTFFLVKDYQEEKPDDEDDDDDDDGDDNNDDNNDHGSSGGGGGGGNTQRVVVTPGAPPTTDPTTPNVIETKPGQIIAQPGTLPAGTPTGATGGVLLLDTKSYSMNPNGMYDIGVVYVGPNTTMRVYSSRNGVARVERRNGKYRVTGLTAGQTYIMFEIYDLNGNLINHASVKIVVDNTAVPGGLSNRACSLF